MSEHDDILKDILAAREVLNRAAIPRGIHYNERAMASLVASLPQELRMASLSTIVSFITGPGVVEIKRLDGQDIFIFSLWSHEGDITAEMTFNGSELAELREAINQILPRKRTRTAADAPESAEVTG